MTERVVIQWNGEKITASKGDQWFEIQSYSHDKDTGEIELFLKPLASPSMDYEKVIEESTNALVGLSYLLHFGFNNRI